MNGQLNDLQIIYDNDKPELDKCIHMLEHTAFLMWRETGADMEGFAIPVEDTRQAIYDFILKWTPITPNQEGSMQLAQDMRIRLGIELVLSEAQSPTPTHMTPEDEEPEMAMLSSLYSAADGQDFSEESTEA